MKPETAVHAHALEAWRHAHPPVENNEQGAIAGARRLDLTLASRP